MATVTGWLCWSPREGSGSDWMTWALPAWRHDALCREPAYGHLNFVPGLGEPVGPLKAVCRRCLVRDVCLDYALADASLEGVWGAPGIENGAHVLGHPWGVATERG